MNFNGLTIFFGITIYALPSVSTKGCTESHIDKFFACTKTQLGKNRSSLTKEFVESIRRRAEKCFGAEGQCQLKGEWDTADNLCDGANVCQCTVCNLLFNGIIKATSSDAGLESANVPCINRVVNSDIYKVAAPCVQRELGMDLHDIMVKNSPDDTGFDGAMSKMAVGQFLLARTNIDRCMHFPEAEPKGRETNECWWQQADEPVGKHTCEIATNCAQEASDSDCTWYSLRKTLSSLCTCMKKSIFDVSNSVTDLYHKAVKTASKQSGQSKADRAKQCIDIVNSVSNLHGVEINQLDNVDNAIGKCLSAKLPFTTREMATAMCEIAADTGRTWKLRHGLAQAPNFFVMYIGEKGLANMHTACSFCLALSMGLSGTLLASVTISDWHWAISWLVKAPATHSKLVAMSEWVCEHQIRQLEA